MNYPGSGLKPPRAGYEVEKQLLLASVPPAVREVLGEETATLLIDRTDTLTRLVDLSETANPFLKPHDDPHEIDLTFLDPEVAGRVKNYTAKPWSETEIAAIVEAKSPAGAAVFVTRLVNAGSDLHKKLKKSSKIVQADVTQVGNSINTNFGDDEDGKPVFSLATAELLLSSLANIADRTPLESAEILENVYSAVLATNIYQKGIAGRTRFGGRFGLNLLPSAIPIAGIKIMRGELKNARDIRASVEAVRQDGAACHKQLIGLVKREQAREADRLLEVVIMAKQQLPTPEQVSTDQLGIFATAEQYLTEQAEMAKAAIEKADPAHGGHQEVTFALESLRKSAFAQAMRKQQLIESQAETHETDKDISWAKNVLRGGSRLRPEPDQTVQQVQQQATALHALKTGKNKELLTPEECGVVMAMATNNFDHFAAIVEHVQSLPVDSPLVARSEQTGVTQEIRALNLATTVTKLKDVLERYGDFREIFGPRVLWKVQEVIDNFLEPQNTSETR